jgi:hypothetical protein
LSRFRHAVGRWARRAASAKAHRAAAQSLAPVGRPAALIRVRRMLAVALLLVAAPASAERVYVKSRGEVDLAPFRCETIARSENVKRICYDAREEYVLVSLKGIWYHFCGVPADKVQEWKKARSKGNYYNDNIRVNYDCSIKSAPAYR